MPISAVPMLFAEGPCAPVPSEVDGDWPTQESSPLMKENIHAVFLSQTACQLAGGVEEPRDLPS